MFNGALGCFVGLCVGGYEPPEQQSVHEQAIETNDQDLAGRR